LVNGEVVKKRMEPKVGDEIEIEFTIGPEIDLKPENIPLDILYEDADIIVVNKPCGMVVHPAPGHWSHTFVNALVYHCQELLKSDEKIRPGIVHRLDKDTTGVLIAAKHAEAQRRLIEAFASRNVKKTYLAIVCGHPENQYIETPIGRSPKQRQKMAVVATGKASKTKIELVYADKEWSVVRVGLETGRTHQIRVHLASIGSPVLGDALYGNCALNVRFSAARQLLHAETLQFGHPISGKELIVKAPYPEDFKLFLQKTR
jgi:23S rRNA pseudouridine1911/1915/1917 synthase